MQEKEIIKEIINNSAQRLKEKYVATHYLELYSKVNNFVVNTQQDLEFKRRFWHYINNERNIPKCATCGVEIKQYRSITQGYAKYCSAKCSAVNKDTKEKRVDTTIEKYGVSNVFKAEIIKDKSKKTCIEKYGVSSPNQVKEIRDKINKTNLERYGQECLLNDVRLQKGDKRWKDARDKQKQTCLEIYGQESASGTKAYMEKIKKTVKEKYNEDVDHWTQTQDYRDKRLATSIEKVSFKFKDDGFISTDLFNITLNCPNCNKEYTEPFGYIKQRKNTGLILCTHCNPFGPNYTSSKELELYDFIKENYNGEVIQRSRKIIHPNEIDLYFPALNLGVEFNGVYYHSEAYLDDKNYHINKTNKCKEKGVKLIHLFEDEWEFKREIVKSKVLNLLGLTKIKIGARKCEIKIVPKEDEKRFLDNNHLQGYVRSEKCYGLYYQNELIALFSISGGRKVTGTKKTAGEYEILRFCNKINYSVIGGMGKLLKYFIKDLNPTKIFSYADKRWSVGNVYESIGMKLVSETVPNYWYLVKGYREHRFKYRKDVLVKQGYDSTKTEHEIMLERKIYRIYDCGSLKYELILT